ncbi:hypothetical protein, partial [Bacillus thuringiensis]|uniref:hypothetical protein n=1 Tax=Bacillus thuringiensis TaxID=1428 RepID=UPI001EDD636F
PFTNCYFFKLKSIIKMFSLEHLFLTLIIWKFSQVLKNLNMVLFNGIPKSFMPYIFEKGAQIN